MNAPQIVAPRIEALYNLLLRSEVKKYNLYIQNEKIRPSRPDLRFSPKAYSLTVTRC
jgi:hypothetical protein